MIAFQVCKISATKTLHQPDILQYATVKTAFHPKLKKISDYIF